ncbi:hypothetical protein [Halodesulfovibrio sp.]|jgi:hypothetical protein|nr:hypothetical protein [Halodesulfovibrio sp.]MCT4625518.1 hypothetical protein [Halodesulfovibrio sp.]
MPPYVKMMLMTGRAFAFGAALDAKKRPPQVVLYLAETAGGGRL